MSYTPDPRLIFDRPPAEDGRLVFGETSDPAGLVTGSLWADIARPVAISGTAATLEPGSLTAQLPPTTTVAASGAAEYLSLTERPVVGQAAARHQAANGLQTGPTLAHEQGTAIPSGATAHHQDAAAADHPVRHRLPGLLIVLHVPKVARHQDGAGQQAAAGLLHQDGVTIPAAVRPAHQDAAPAQRGAGLRHQDGTHAWQGRRARHQDGRSLSHAHRARHQLARLLLKSWRIRHQDGRVPPPGARFAPPEPGPTPPGYVPDPRLVFCFDRATSGRLIFGLRCGNASGAALYILPARYYMAVHQLEAHRLPDLTPVPIFDVSLSADAGSFGWSFSASSPRSAFDLLAPASGLPAQIRITLDGLQFVFAVDALRASERFGQRVVQISGRSITALLSRPHARETTRGNPSAPATAQQLALSALEYTGVGLDWGLTDWLVPVGAWSHIGTPLAAVQAIAEAAGGYLQSHRSAPTILVRHPYPTLPGGIPGGPWNWSAPGVVPDVELAADALITTEIERRDGADLNAVYVSGTTQGVLALVKRAGTAGEKLAQLVTDPLITAVEAAQQRGLGVLGDAGPKHLVSLTLPVLTGIDQPGVLDVGQLVQVNQAAPWRGRVRSVSVNARMPSVRQTVQIERHLEPA